MEEFLHENDCFIERDNFGRAVLIRHDGEFRRVLPGEWTDQQVWEALKMANTFYAFGLASGKLEKINEIKRVLRIEIK
jgi:hypothetical protein